MIKIPNYTVKKVIGQGGMALVYLAEQDMLSREVALKVLLPDMMKDDTLRKSFLNEGKIVASLKHPNIVSIFDIGIVDDSIFYMTMEYINGGTLKEKLLEGKFSYSNAVKVLEEIAEGLSYAHDKGYIHRDIKPANILFHEDGSAVVTDFGIAKLQDTSGDLTRQGLTAGTAQYMSPEQAKSSKLDSRSDIYSLGLVFFEILAGEKAYKFDTHHQAIHLHTTAPPPKLPKETAFLQTIIDKVLAKNPKDRYQTTTEFVEAVKDAGLPTLSSSLSTENTIQTDKTIIHGTKPSSINTQKKKPYFLSASILAGLIIIGAISFGITKFPIKTIKPEETTKEVINIEKNPTVKAEDKTPSEEKTETQFSTLINKDSSSKCKGIVRINGVLVSKGNDSCINGKKPIIESKKPSSECRGIVRINGVQVGKGNSSCSDNKNKKVALNTRPKSVDPVITAKECVNLASLVEKSLLYTSSDNDFLGTPIHDQKTIKCAQKSLYHQLKIYKKSIRKGDYETLEEFIYPPIRKSRTVESLGKILKLPYLPSDNVIRHTQVIEIPIKKYSKGIYARTLYNIEMSMNLAVSQKDLQQTIKDGRLKEAQKTASKHLKKEYGALDIRFKKDTLEATFSKRGKNIAIYEINKGWSIMAYDATVLNKIQGELPKEVVKYLSLLGL